MEDFLLRHADDFEQLANGKVRCKRTGHEMPPRVDVLQSHLQSRAYTRAVNTAALDLDKYKAFIVPHREQPDTKVYCVVTKISLNRDPQEVEKHVKGRRFLNSLQQYQKRQEARAAAANGAEDGESGSDGGSGMGSADDVDVGSAMSDEEEGEEDGGEEDEDEDEDMDKAMDKDNGGEQTNPRQHNAEESSESDEAETKREKRRRQSKKVPKRMRAARKRRPV